MMTHTDRRPTDPLAQLAADAEREYGHFRTDANTPHPGVTVPVIVIVGAVPWLLGIGWVVGWLLVHW